MQYEKKPNTGVIFLDKAKQKEKKDGTPYWFYGGSLNIECPHCQKMFEMWLNSELKPNTKAGRILSVWLNLMEKKHDNEIRVDDIPF